MFRNVYQDEDYARSYSALDWSGTYYLIYRDLPAILQRHVAGTRALDFGCGTGRSSRLLRSYGYEVLGVDISGSMIRNAKQADSGGNYLLISSDNFNQLASERFDLILASFPFDNIPHIHKPALFRSLAQLLNKGGRIVNIVSSPEIYTHEWFSFSTRDFPKNRLARDGDIVRIVTTEFRGNKPAEDVLCTEEAYRKIYGTCGLDVLAIYKPLAHGDENVSWISETQVAPWVIYVLASAN